MEWSERNFVVWWSGAGGVRGSMGRWVNRGGEGWGHLIGVNTLFHLHWKKEKPTSSKGDHLPTSQLTIDPQIIALRKRVESVTELLGPVT